MDEDQSNEAEHRREVMDRIDALKAEFIRLGAGDRVPEYIDACWTLGEYCDVLENSLPNGSSPPTSAATPFTRALDPLVPAVMTAIASRGYSADEWHWINRIERRRRDLLDSSEVLEYMDYGAGAPSDVRAAEQMHAGTPAHQTIGHLTRVASKDPKWAGLLLRIVRETKPRFCVEMGAAAGISGAYQACGLRLNKVGRFVSLEGGRAVAELAAQTLKTLGLDDLAEVRTGRFQDTLQPALEQNPIDYIFVDGHHDGPATIEYFNTITTRMTRGVVLFDDVDWSPGMSAAWAEIFSSERLAAAFDLGRLGVCVIGHADRPLRCRIDY